MDEETSVWSNLLGGVGDAARRDAGRYAFQVFRRFLDLPLSSFVRPDAVLRPCDVTGFDVTGPVTMGTPRAR